MKEAAGFTSSYRVYLIVNWRWIWREHERDLSLSTISYVEFLANHLSLLHILLLASLLSLPSTLASQTLLVTSSSLASLNSISLPSPIEPSTESLTLSSQNWSDIIKTLEAEGAAVKDYEFALKGEEVWVHLFFFERTKWGKVIKVGSPHEAI